MTTAGAAYSRNRGFDRRTAITQAQPNSGTSARPSPPADPHAAPRQRQADQKIAPPTFGHFVADQALDQWIEPAVSLHQLVAMGRPMWKKLSGL